MWKPGSLRSVVHLRAAHQAKSLSPPMRGAQRPIGLRDMRVLQAARCTDLRPADILTQATGNGFTSLDVGITSPDARYAGIDCTESMVQRKLAHYRPHSTALEQQNINYLPLIFSSYGRPNARAVTTLRTLSKRISRRRGTVTAQAVYQGLMSAVSTEIWRRAAKQVFHCWPGGSRDISAVE